MRTTNFGSGIVVAALSLVALVWLIPNHTKPAQMATDLPPAFMPSVAVTTCLVLAVLLTVLNRPRGAVGDEAAHEEFGEEASGMGRAEFVNLALWLGLAALIMTLLQYAGFFVAGAVLLALAMLYVGLRRPVVLVPLVLGVPAALYWIVWFAFTVELP